ncbi:MAG: hypothetical protein IKL10_06790 [Clostridia bacterium]|nr:hypothetical protein [Clostridia bacterium]
MKKIIEKKTKTIFIPKLHKNDDALFVGVNGKRILVKKGETVELPVHFAEVIENSMKAQKEAESFIERSSSED